jgi:hypothetical protein
VILLVFAAVALYLDKDAIVIESLKIVGPFVIGALGGYSYGRSRGPRTEDEDK